LDGVAVGLEAAGKAGAEVMQGPTEVGPPPTLRFVAPEQICQMLAGYRPFLDRQVAQERQQLGGREQELTASLYPGRTQKPQMSAPLHLCPVVRSSVYQEIPKR
jgi:hypothetical protein